MKKIILLISVIFSSSLLASNLEWSELVQYNEYKLTQNIIFENGIGLDAEDVYELREIEPLSIPGYPMLYYSFHKKNCTRPDLTAEMVIVEISGNDQDSSVGAQLEEGCNLALYLEVKDYYRSSSFKE